MAAKRKRGNGEGSIFPIDGGRRWRAAVMVGWKTAPDGRRIPDRKVFSAATRHEVAELLTTALRDRDRGISIKATKLTVGGFLSHWLEHTVKPSVRPKTYISYEQMVRCHIAKTVPPEQWKDLDLDDIPGFKGLPLSKLTLQRVQEFFAKKLGAGNSPSLVRYLRIVFRIALAEAVRADLLPRNVAALARPPKVEKKETVPFTADQAKRFLQAAMGHRLEALYTSALALGLRSGECSALRWSDVEMDAAKITVRATLQRIKQADGKSALVLLPPKSEKSRRVISIPAICVSALRAHQERQSKERELAGSAWRDTGHVFTTTIGTPLDDSKILKEFDALTAAAKLPKQRFHDLRHACISLLAARGVPLKVIAEIVGHSDVRLTQNIYQHAYDEAKVEAAAKMDAVLSGGALPEPVATTVATKPASKALN